MTFETKEESGNAASSKSGTIVTLLALNLVWAAMAVWGWVYFRTSLNLNQNGVEVQAIVIENLQVSSDDGDSYKPVFQFTIDGQTYTHTSPNSSYPAKYDVGETETLLVDPANPEQAGVQSFSELWLAPLALWCGAAFAALLTNGIAAGMLMATRQKAALI